MYGPTITKIFSQPWDLVVLQEQSELPSFPPAEVDTEVYPYAYRLDSMVHANNSCTQTLFMLTWGHANGDPLNCGAYPVICTYLGMQERLRQSYLQMAVDNSAIIGPVGAAFKIVKDSVPSLWLYQSDSSHPNIQGSYLQTCVLYSSIFHRRSIGCAYLGGVSSTQAATLQHFADKVTMDSLAAWQLHGHYPYAGFSKNITGSTVHFTPGDPISAANSWTFGDGGTDTAVAPNHTYPATGTFVVTHRVSNSCFTEVLTDTVNILTTGTPVAASTGKILALTSAGRVTLVSVEARYDWVEIYRADGKVAGRYSFSGNKIEFAASPGMYLYKAWSPDSGVSTGRFVIMSGH